METPAHSSRWLALAVLVGAAALAIGVVAKRSDLLPSGGTNADRARLAPRDADPLHAGDGRSAGDGPSGSLEDDGGSTARGERGDGARNGPGGGGRDWKPG